MHIQPVRTDSDHEAALREIEALWGADENTESGNRLDVLATLVESYESRRWPEPMDNSIWKSVFDPVDPLLVNQWMLCLAIDSYDVTQVLGMNLAQPVYPSDEIREAKFRLLTPSDDRLLYCVMRYSPDDRYRAWEGYYDGTSPTAVFYSTVLQTLPR